MSQVIVKQYVNLKLGDIKKHLIDAKKLSSEKVVIREIDYALEDIELTKKGME